MSNLRDELLRRRLENVAPRVFLGQGGDPVTEMLDAMESCIATQREAKLLEEQRLAAEPTPAEREAELRREILRRGLQHLIPRIYNGTTRDVVGGLLDKLEELTTNRDRRELPQTPEDDDDDDEESDLSPGEAERTRLRALADWIRQETADGQPIHRYPEVLHVVEQLAENPEHPLPVTPRAVPVAVVRTQEHRFRDFPFGFLWCIDCGAVWRRGEVHRYFNPGTGEVSELPTCPGPRGPEENTDL